MKRCTSALSKLAERTDALFSTTRELRYEQTKFDGRVCALEERRLLRAAGDRLESQFAARLEALEQAKYNSELILFGVREISPESPRDVATSVASALGVEVSSGEIETCYRIPAKGDNPCPLIVRLASCISTTAG